MRILIRVYAPFFLLLALVAAVCARWDLPVHLFTQEPQVLARLPWYAGGLAMITGWLWCAAAAACLIGWSLLRARRDADRLPAFLLYFGLLSLGVLLDDAFQLHERSVAWFGIREKAVYSAYLAVLVLGLFSFRYELLKSDFRLLLSSALFLGLSVIVDVLQSIYGERLGPWRPLFEDGFKLLGAAGWLGYFWTTASGALSRSSSTHDKGVRFSSYSGGRLAVMIGP